MDLDRVKTTPAKHPGSRSRVPSAVAQSAQPFIRQRLAQAEQFIRQQRPTQALALLQSSGMSPRAWPLLWRPRWYLLVGWSMMECNQPREARAILEQGLKTLKRLLRRPNAARRPFLREWKEWLHCFLGASLCRNDQPIQALFCYRQTLRTIGRSATPDPSLMMFIFKGIGEAYLALGAYADAMAFLLLAKQRGQDVHDPLALGWIEWSLGLGYKCQGEFLQARQAFSLGLALFEQLEGRSLVSQLQSHLGQVYICLQHYDEAEVLLRQALGAAERAGDPLARVIALQSLAALHLARRQPGKAIRMLQDGLVILKETENPRIAGQIYLELSRAHESQRDLVAAEEALVSAITALAQTQQYGLLVRAHERYAQVLADQGRFKEAYEQLRMAPPQTAASLGAGTLYAKW